MMGFTAAGETGGDQPQDNLRLAVPGILAAGCAVAALVTGVLAMFRARDRSAGVAVSVVVGGLVAVFLVGEAIVPH